MSNGNNLNSPSLAPLLVIQPLTVLPGDKLSNDKNTNKDQVVAAHVFNPST